MAGPNNLFTDWLTGDIITAQRLNLVKNAIAPASERDDSVECMVIIGGSIAPVTTLYRHRQFIGDMVFENFGCIVTITGLSGTVTFGNMVNPRFSEQGYAASLLGLVFIHNVTGTSLQNWPRYMMARRLNDLSIDYGLVRGSGAIIAPTERPILNFLSLITESTSGTLGMYGNLAYHYDPS